MLTLAITFPSDVDDLLLLLENRFYFKGKNLENRESYKQTLSDCQRNSQKKTPVPMASLPFNPTQSGFQGRPHKSSEN